MANPLIQYIEVNYNTATFDEHYSVKTKNTTWRSNNTCVEIGYRKWYISIYFSNKDAVSLIAKRYQFCKCNKGCVNLTYKKIFLMN